MTVLTAPVARRTFLTGSAALTVGAVLAACGRSGDNQAGGNSIELVTYNLPEYVDAISATVGAEFARRTGITVELVNTGGNNYESVDQRVQSDIAAGRAPELALVSLSAIDRYAESGRAAQLDGVMKESAFETTQLYPDLLDLGSRGGHLFAVPYALSTLVLFYNVDAFRQAGLDPDRPPSTFSELRGHAERLVSNKATRYGAIYGNDHSGNWAFQCFLASNGGAMLSDDGRTPLFNDEPGLQVVQFWADLYEAGLGETMPRNQMREAFARGDLAIMFDSSASATSIADSASFEVRTAMTPVPDGGTRRCPSGGGAFVILTDDPTHQRAAFDAIAELVGPAGQTALVKGSGYSPVNRVAATDAQYLAGFLADRPIYAAGTAQLDSLVPWFSFPGRHSAQISKVLDEAIVQALRGSLPSREALDAAARRAHDLLQDT
ncbi:ABC transporter substrate-binding protein [Mycobacterium sp. pW049]|uniref:ABC transporter substrate-binding protein n=1 Tax=[Mycobacterium] bulgaricum TaxID=3238985 RepID=UPI00351B6D46